MEGRTVSHYRVLRLLGSGGMGVVYEARDTRLGRAVAVKFLAEALASDRQAVERFLREARAASALNHPNICTVYDVGEEKGRHFIVLELLEGRTLGQTIGSRPLPLDSVLGFATQVASALEAAHGEGIVHRDLKPANVFVVAGGRVKVLDFGLAKQTTTPASNTEVTITGPGGGFTRPGAMMGTLGYMSPEQVRGQPLDARSDLFSFGVVLYEMATGKTPFPGDTSGLVLEAILSRDPPLPSQLNPGVPRELDRIVAKALEKERETRYQTVRDMLADLRRLDRDTGAGKSGRRDGPSPRAMRRRVLLGASAALLLVALAVSLSPPPRLRVKGYVRLTSDELNKLKLATDGSRLYFTETPDFSAAHVATSGGEVTRIRLPFAAVVLDVAPDGSDLLVVKALESFWTPQELWLVPTAGGTPRRVGDVLGNTAAFSPDGRMIAYTAGRDVRVTNSDGSGIRTVWTAPGQVWAVAWSPDAQRLAATVKAPSQAQAGAIWEVGIEGRNSLPLLPDFPLPTCCGQWTPDGTRFVFEALGERTTDLWVVPRAKGLWRARSPQPVRLTEGPLDFAGPISSRDGRRLFAVGRMERGELVRYDAASRQWVPHALPKHPAGLSAGLLDFSRDGKWLAFIAYPQRTLWRSRADGSERLQLTSPSAGAYSPLWSPDGKRIAFLSQTGDQPPRLLLVSVDGGPPAPVPVGELPVLSLSWSPDGQRLLVGADPGGHRADRPITIALLDLATKQQRSIAGSEGLSSPLWSPDGHYLAALSHDAHRLLIHEFASARWRTLLSSQEPLSWPEWSRHRLGLFVSEGDRRVRVDLPGGQREVVASLAGMRWLGGPFWGWIGLAPDDSLLALRDDSIREIFSMEWDES
jgi:eukaryotic-like serine/threonine-protein kinase